METKALPLVLLMGFLVGSNLVVSRFGVGQINPVTFSALKFVLAALFYVVVYAFGIGGHSLPRGKRIWTLSALLGIFNDVVSYTLIVIAMQFQSSGLTTILISLNPAFITILAHFLLNERINSRKIMGLVLAFAGAALLILRGESGLHEISQARPLGYILVLVAVSCVSISMVLTRKYMRDLDTFDVTGIRMMVGAVFLLPLSVVVVGFDLQQADWRGFLVLAYAAFAGTLLLKSATFYSLRRYGASTVAVGDYVSPVVAGVLGVTLLGERFTLVMAAGMVLIIAGIATLNLSKRTSPKARPVVDPIVK